MSRLFLILLSLLGLNACDSAQQSVANAAAATRNELHQSAQKFGELLGTRTKPAEKRLNAPARYCYRTYHDIICYGSPLPGEEYRLVGYQEGNGHTGTVMPSAAFDGGPGLPPLKSITVKPPSPIKETPAAPHLEEIRFDRAELEPKVLVPMPERP